MKRIRSAWFILLLLLLVGATASYAQGTPPPLIEKALADLSQKLGTTVGLSNLTNWSYQQDFYNDTALGCTLTSGQPVTQPITAYRFALEYKGTTYDYRVSADGNLVVGCDAGLLNVPSAPTGTPAAGCPAAYAGYLTPKLKVGIQARVIATNSAPNRLRSTPSTDGQQLGLIQPGRTFDVIGGPSCGQNYVWWQVSYNGQTGWTVEGQLPSTYYVEAINAPASPIATLEATAAVVETGAATAVATAVGTLEQPPAPAAPAAVNAALAGVTNKLLTLYNLDDNGVPTAYANVADVSGANGITLGEAAWSPDGQFLAYTVFDPNYVATLYVTDRAGSAPVQLATDVYTQLPISFTADSAQVVYGKVNRDAPTPTSSSNGPATDMVQIFTQPVSSGTAVSIATIPFGVGCGGGSPYPGDWQINSETGYSGRRLVLAMTPAGIVYSTRCTGFGTALLKLDSGQTVDVGTDLSRVSVSPDGTKVVGIAANPQTPLNGVLTMVDLQTLQPTPLGTSAAPDQVTWGPDGSLYYSVITSTTESIPGSDSAPDGMGAHGLMRHRVSIHHVDLNTTTDSEIYAASAYAIGRMMVTPDNQALYFSSVPNGDRYVDALNKGVLTPQSAQTDLLAYFPVEFYRIGQAGGSAALVSSDLAKATLNSGAFASAAAPVEAATTAQPTAQG